MRQNHQRNVWFGTFITVWSINHSFCPENLKRRGDATEIIILGNCSLQNQRTVVSIHSKTSIVEQISTTQQSTKKWYTQTVAALLASTTKYQIMNLHLGASAIILEFNCTLLHADAVFSLMTMRMAFFLCSRCGWCRMCCKTQCPIHFARSIHQ